MVALWGGDEASRASRAINATPKFFRQHNIGCGVGRKILTKLPKPRQQHEMGITGDPQVKQIT
jgi:hypothetical protein